MKNIKSPQDLPTPSANDEVSEPGGKAGSSPDKLLTTEQVAAWLGIKKGTLEKARSTRIGDYPPYIKVNRLIRYRRSDVEAWLARKTCQSATSVDLATAA